MNRHVRPLVLALVSLSLLAFPVAARASFGIESWFAANCNAAHEGCKKHGGTPAEEKKAAEEEGFTQAGGHPPFGVTDFRVKTTGGKPEGAPVTHIRVDVAPGLSTNPQAVPKCGEKTGESFGSEVGKGVFTPPVCNAQTELGENKVVVYIEGLGELALKGTVYNLIPPTGRSSEFGVAVELPELLTGGVPGLFAHTLIEGNVEWGAEAKGTGKADYHDYFEINVSPELPLVESRLIFKGNIGTLGKGGFITNPTSCTGAGPQTTSTLHLTAQKGETSEMTYTTPIGTENCGAIPFEPLFTLKPATTQSDVPDGITTELVVPHPSSPTAIDSSQLKTAEITLPEGMTMNPSAAHGLEACTPAQIAIHTTAAVTCPAASKLGTVTIETPNLPPGSLQGNIYLGGPSSGPITGPPYTIYLDAESARYGVSVRIRGEVIPNPATGQVTTIFSENPEQPLGNAILSFNSGALAPIANPLVCGTATSLTALTPFSAPGTTKSPTSAFAVDSNGAGGACASPPPLALSQSTANQTGKAGGHTSYTFNLARGDGQQYISQVRTVLPEGLVGAVPLVVLCPEAQANAGTCSAASQIGTATVQAGSGPTPFTFSGPVYMTGPYNGAPFGLSIVVPAVAGPFDLGNVITRASVGVEAYSSRVVVTSVLPRIVGGVPIRVKNISVSVNKQGFLFNPTNCGALATESLISGFTLLSGGVTGTQSLSSPFGVTECNKLSFKPAFKAAGSARTSKANGASLETTINQAAGQANIRSVKVQLPVQLPSRLTTLQQACLAATFEHNPYECPKGSFVGGVRANTPVLPAKMTGPAILVSHANAAFPDLDLVLEGNGVRVILVGNTDIKNGITTTTFASTPDVPVSSVTVNLPIGPHSALAAYGNVCAKSLIMPTTIVGQNGVTIKQNTRINVRSCPVRIVRQRVSGNSAYVTVSAPRAGRVSGGNNSSLVTVYHHVRGASTVTIRVPLSRRGLGRGRPFSVRLRVGFVPSSRSERSSAAFVTVRF